MSTSPQRVTLPQRDEMMQRLITVSNHPTRVEKFYPRILDHAANSELTALAVVNSLQLATAEFLELIELRFRGAVDWVLQGKLDQYLTALIDDESVLAEALTIMQEARQKAQ